MIRNSNIKGMLCGYVDQLGLIDSIDTLEQTLTTMATKNINGMILVPGYHCTRGSHVCWVLTTNNHAWVTLQRESSNKTL